MDELDISEDTPHPELSPEERQAQAGGGQREPEPRPADGPTYQSDPERRAAVLDRYRHREPRARQDEMWPYLLIRAQAGDTGVRQPPVGYCWESPDIVVVEGVVDRFEGHTPTLNPVAGRDHTVFVRVWNLGRFPAYATQVRLWWANPSFAFDAGSPSAPVFVGGAVVDLADRYSFPDCRVLVRIDAPWNPVVVNGGHECLLAKVDCQADPAPPGWEASTARHVGQRNLDLIVPDGNLAILLERLSLALPLGADVHLLHGMRAVETLVAAQGPDFAEHARLLSPVEMPWQATPLRDGQGHLGAMVRSGEELSFIPGPEAADRFSSIDQGGDRGRPAEFDPNARPDVLVDLFRRVFDVDVEHAGNVAGRLGPDAAHLLRFVATNGRSVVGGYSIIVHG